MSEFKDSQGCKLDEWWVVFVPDPERWGPLPEDGVLGVRDLPAALDGVGLRPGDPVFVRPDFVVDTELLQFVLSPEFRGLERESRRNYATDIRLLLSWLWRRGVPWRSATSADLRAYKEFRLDSPLNPQRIGGTKWNRDAVHGPIWTYAAHMSTASGRRARRIPTAVCRAYAERAAACGPGGRVRPSGVSNRVS